MKFSVMVSPIVVAGTDRGGEDLFIRFSVKTTERPDLSNLNFEIDLENEWEVNGDNVHFMTSHYDFEWNGTREDLRKMAAQFLINEQDWSANLAGTEFRFEHDEYIDGNAD